jgi:hypothetical protein
MLTQSPISQHLGFKMKNLIRKLKLNIIGTIIIVFVFFHLSTLISHFGTAHAEGVALGISPAIFQIEAMPPSDVRAPFTITNQGSKPVDLKILLLPFRASDKENGEIQYVRSTNPSLFEKIQVVDENEAVDVISLGPKQEKKLELRIVVPEKERSADYYFSIVFMALPKSDRAKSDEKNNISTAQGGISANVLLSIGPNEGAQAHLEEFSTPWYVESGPVPFTIRVRNNGSHVIAPKGTILITNMYGQTIGKVEIPATNILAGTVRSLIDLEQASTNSAKLNNESTRALWPEKFLLGVYKAELTLKFPNDGPEMHKTIRFVAFPLKILLGIAISIIIVLTIYYRVKKRLQNE